MTLIIETIEAGYFEEDKEFNFKYSDYFDLPTNQTVIQFSGAFWPFHEGHMSILKSAIQYLNISRNIIDGTVVLHVDHSGYRNNKGNYSESLHKEVLSRLSWEFPYFGFDILIIEEDNIPNNCSRNFTRLYQELMDHKNDVYFLCGGDRSAFSLSFKDEGKCIVSGRDNNPLYKYYLSTNVSDRMHFISGNNEISSTEIRKKFNEGCI